MPAFTTPTGASVRVPGVYSDFEVVSSLPGALPAFLVPFVMGGGEWGFPFDVKDHAEDHESYSQFQWCGTASAAKSLHGQDSDLGLAFEVADRHGLPGAFCVCMSALTRASVVATSGAGAVNQAKVYARRYGWVGGWIKVAAVLGLTVSVQVPNRFTRLTENALLTDTRIYVRDNSWIEIGSSYEIGDNSTVNAAVTVADKGIEFDSNGQVLYWVEFTAAVGSALATSGYAAVVEYPAGNTEDSPTFTTAAQVMDWLRNTSQWIDAVQEGTWTGATWDALATLTPIKDIAAWGAVIGGTSPSPTSTDYDDFVTDMNASEWDGFVLAQGVVPRMFLVVDSSNTVHEAMRDWALSMRSEGYPIAIVSGCDWGDTVIGAGNSTAPEWRTARLNSQDVQLCAGGWDYLPAYMTIAPALFGLRAGNDIGHNLTEDGLFYTDLEQLWDERDSGEHTTLARAGAVTYRLSVGRTPAFKVSQGLTTLQANTESWNTSDGTTCLSAQRDLADYVDRVIKQDLTSDQLGADEVTPATIAAAVRRRAEKSLKARGYIVDFRIDLIELASNGAGYNVTWTAQLPVTGDYIGLTTRILVG